MPSAEKGDGVKHPPQVGHRGGTTLSRSKACALRHFPDTCQVMPQPPFRAELVLCNEESIANLLPALLPRLWKFALRLTGSHLDAEELVQCTCVRALEYAHQWELGSSALSWVFSIMHSTWLNEVRARRLYNRVHIAWEDDLLQRIPDPAAANQETRRMCEDILTAVSRLPEPQRDAIVVICAEGMSYREAAQILGVPIGTVMSRVSRARASVAAMLLGESATDDNEPLPSS